MKVRDILKLIEEDGWYGVQVKGGHRQHKHHTKSGRVTGKTRDQAAKNMHVAIKMHLEGLKEDGLPIPRSHSSAEHVAVT